MKRILLLTSLVISSFGMINLQTVQAAPQQSNAASPTLYAKAKRLVSQVNIAVKLEGDQFGKVNNLCIDYYKKLDAMSEADKTTKAAALKDELTQKIKAVLTPAQAKQMPALKD